MSNLCRLFICVLLLTSVSAWSDCNTPVGQAGQLSLVSGSVHWCDGTNWQDPAMVMQLSCIPGEQGIIQYTSGDAQICDGSFWYSILGTSGEVCSLAEIGTLTWRGSYRKMQYCDGYNWHVPYVAAAPSVTSLNINSGAVSTVNNNIATDLGANVVDSQSVLTHFCYKSSPDASVPAAPLAGDNCWQAFDSPSPGLTPAANLSFTGHYYRLGFTEATYTVFAWVKTSAGQVSTLSNGGVGTDGVDKKSILFQPNPPPEVINILSAASDGATFPLGSSDTTTAAGSTVYIKWKATSVGGFGPGPISLYYTEDEENFTLISSGVANTANSGCTVDGTTFNGCYRWTNGSPSSSYYRIRVIAEDSIGMTTFNTGPGMNTYAFNTLAGNTDPGLGGSAQSAIIFNYVDSLRNDEKSFVVTPDGTFYIRDSVQGIVKVDPADGLYSQFIPYSGTSTDGPIGAATLGYSYARMTLDFDNNLIIYDHTKIRKVNLATNMVSTIVGGGATVASGTDALDFSMSCASADGEKCPLTVLPNGDMYFLRRVSRSGKPSSGESIWHYSSADDKVYSITPSGTGATTAASLDIEDSWLTGLYLAFDPATSSISKFYGAFMQDPCVGCGPQYKPAELNQTTWASMGVGFSNLSGYTAQITAMNGLLYMLTHQSAVYQYDEVGDSWTKILGSGSIGTCADETLAINCDAHIQDAFVTAQGEIYFLDGGLVRTIDNAGEIVTIFGQKRNYGDGDLAISARFNKINSIDETTSGKIAVLDVNENVIREFTVGGTISRLIGDGSTSGVVSGDPGTSVAAPGGYWGGNYNIRYNDSNENLYFYSGSSIYRFDRSDGNVYAAVGHGGTAFDSADGLVGSSIQVGGYPEIIYGFNGTNLILGSHYWNGTSAERSYLKFYDVTDSYRQSHFTGAGGGIPGSFPADGTPVATASIPSEGGNRYKMGVWDSATSTWFFSDGAKIRSFPLGGNVGTFVTLPRGVSSWTMLQNGASDWVVYYCSSSRVYKYNVTTTVETALPWPSPSVACGGTTMHRSASRNSIVFPYVQNGLWAIGEIVDTP